MKRLTQKHYGANDYYMACSEECERDHCLECAELEKIVDLLGAYEDTGLTPAEIRSMRMDMAIIRTLFQDAEVERLKELAESDKEGRVAVLPCKVGDMVWVTGQDNVARAMVLEAPDIRAVCTDEDNLCMSTCNRKPNGFCAYRLRNDGSDINKTVF